MGEKLCHPLPCPGHGGADSSSSCSDKFSSNLITVFIPSSAKKKKMADKILPQRVSPDPGSTGQAWGGVGGEQSMAPDPNGISLFPKIRELVPESQAYMDLLAFERKLDQTIMRKRLDIQEALKRPIKVTEESARQSAKGEGTGAFGRDTAQLSLAFKLHLSLPPTR